VDGTVILETTISRSGCVSDISVLRSVPLLDVAAMIAVARWRYTPTLLNGRPVPVVMAVTVNFHLAP
jgi:protein TonB